jgi:SAM-dependent methyltransferase
LTVNEPDGQAEAFVHAWVRAMLNKDVAAAERLRAAEYTLWLGAADMLGRDEELALIADPAHRFHSVEVEEVVAAAGGAGIQACIRVAGDFSGTTVDSLYRYSFRCRREAGHLVAHRLDVEQLSNPEETAGKQPRQPLLRRLLGRAAQAAGLRRANTPPDFQSLAYLPYAPGEDYVLGPYAPPIDPNEALPLPPEALRLGYKNLAHGEDHVRTMLDIAAQSGFTPAQGHRILDLGCGSGRMIRHLRHLGDRCEIWGTDISAPHIAWCKQHLSPPFHFATTTKVPHLPFEDRSFQFIYCGSLFTHIDDLADAWLLELKRILAPEGRLYVTVHDEETIRLFDSIRYSQSDMVQSFKRNPAFQAAKSADFGMFTLGRDDQSQVFYRRAFFERMAGSAFDTLSITSEAYYYQTAFLLARKDRPTQ